MDFLFFNFKRKKPPTPPDLNALENEFSQIDQVFQNIRGNTEMEKLRTLIQTTEEKDYPLLLKRIQNDWNHIEKTLDTKTQKHQNNIQEKIQKNTQDQLQSILLDQIQKSGKSPHIPLDYLEKCISKLKKQTPKKEEPKPIETEQSIIPPIHPKRIVQKKPEREPIPTLNATDYKPLSTTDLNTNKKSVQLDVAYEKSTSVELIQQTIPVSTSTGKVIQPTIDTPPSLNKPIIKDPNNSKPTPALPPDIQQTDTNIAPQPSDQPIPQKDQSPSRKDFYEARDKRVQEYIKKDQQQSNINNDI